MSDPYMGEIRLFAGSFAPAGWAFCAGQLMPISENDALFNLIGTTYGGDGQETFGLPDLQGRVPIHQGSLAGRTFTIGEKAGVESVTLTLQQIPIHNHLIQVAGTKGDLPNAQGNLLGDASGTLTPYHPGGGALAMNANSLVPQGGSQPHENLQPYLAISYIISLFGIFPHT